ncbi:MAG TPA: PAS domain S-box protein, partial [Myxococcota bacterium]|nr:PAS domain S-box protein [Myxococcota bacterium]
GSRLRLSATTDPQLQKKAYFQEVYYERPQNQLTSWVWREGLSLRLSLVDDAAAIYKKTGMLRSCAQHPEFGASGEEGVQFLAVPIRHREEVLGVIRCSRVREQVGFTPDDEQALVSFSELLALVVRTTREGKVAAALEQASGAAVALTHGEGHRERVTWINQHGRSLTRNPQEDPVGKPLAEVFDRRLPEYWDIRGTPVEVPLAEDRWYELTVQTLNDPLFLPPRKMNLGIARDITERKRATRTLENMRRVMEGLGFAWFDVGMDGRIREVSENESRILGYSREELLALPRKELWYEKEDRAAMLREAEYAGGQLQKLVWLKHKNKHKVGVEAFVRLGPHTPGQEPELAGFYLDVTERLRLQRGLELEDDQILDYTKMANQLRLREQRQLDYLSAVTHQLK